MRAIAANIAEFDRIVVPKPIDDYTSGRVLKRRSEGQHDVESMGRRGGDHSAFGGVRCADGGPGAADSREQPGAPAENRQHRFPNVAPWSESERLSKEKEILGFYISGHPLEPYQLECELFDRNRYHSQIEARMSVFEFIEGWYNPHRRHSSIGDTSPIKYERSYFQEISGRTPENGFAGSRRSHDLGSP